MTATSTDTVTGMSSGHCEARSAGGSQRFRSEPVKAWCRP